MRADTDVVVVGAGIAGMAAARALSDGGLRVRVCEKDAAAGGRMATLRRGSAVFDHGAQFFTTRSAEFTSVVAEAIEAGVVEIWCDGFGDEPDGFPRYRGRNSMSDLVVWMASGLDTTFDFAVSDLSEVPAKAYVLTAPVAESLALLDASGIDVPTERASELAGLVYKQTITVLVKHSGSPLMPSHGGIQFEPGDDLAFVTDNQRKGISEEPAVTIHLSNEVSASMWERSDADVVGVATALTSEILDVSSVVEAHVHRWPAAGPTVTHPDRAVLFGESPLVALAGEIFGGPKVEGAFLSGRAAAAGVLEFLI